MPRGDVILRYSGSNVCRSIILRFRANAPVGTAEMECFAVYRLSFRITRATSPIGWVTRRSASERSRNLSQRNGSPLQRVEFILRVFCYIRPFAPLSALLCLVLTSFFVIRVPTCAGPQSPSFVRIRRSKPQKTSILLFTTFCSA